MAKVLIEFQVDAKGGVETINKVKEALGGVGINGKVVEDSLSKADAQLKRVMDRLDPTAAAAKRFSSMLAELNSGLARGTINQAEFNKQVELLNAKANTAAGGLSRLAKEGVGQLTSALMGVAGMAAITRFLVDGTRAAMEETRALSQLSNVVKQFGGDGIAAAAATERLAKQLLNIGLDNEVTIKAVRDLTIQTHDWSQAISAAALAADMFARTGKDYGTSLAIIQDLVAGKARAVIRANLEFGTSAKTAQEALDALEKQNRGYAATLDDNLQKTQAWRAELQEFSQTIGGPLSDALVFIIQMFKGLGAIASAIVLPIYQVYTGIVALIQAMKAASSGNFAGAQSALSGWVQASKAEWQGLVESIEHMFDGKTIKAESFKRLVIDPIKGGEEAAKKLKEQIKETDKAISQMFGGGSSATYGANYFTSGRLAAGLSGRYAAGGGLGIETDRAFSEFAIYAGKNFGLVMGQEIPGGIVDGLKQGIPELGGMSDEMAREFGEAFRDGFLTIFQGGDFQDAWKSLWGGLAGMAAQSFGGIFTSLMKGEKPDLGAAGITKEGGGVNWGGVAMMGGGLLASYGMARQNRGIAALGGAMSGAGMGATIGSIIPGIGTVIGAVIGGILGAVAGYFSSGGPKQYGYNIDMSRRVGGLPFLEMGGGTGPIQEQEMARQLMDRQVQVSGAFRDLLRDMNVSIDKLPLILTAWKGNTADLNAVFSAILKGELPRAVFAAYRDLLTGGLMGLGVSGGRAGQLLGAFDTGDFDKALASLQAYVAALMKLQSLAKDLSKDLVTLQEELTRTVRETWLTSMEDALEEIGELSGGLDQLTSDEQVARAQQIADISEAQYKANLAYLQSIYDAQKEIGQAWEDMFFGFREAEAGEQGPEAQKAFYKTQLEKLQSQLAGAGSVEELQRIMQLIQQAGMALWKLGGTQETGMYDEAASTREWVEQFLRDQQAAADLLFAQWAEEVKAQNEALRLAIVGITDALTGENGLQKGLSGFQCGLNDASGGLARLKLAADDAAGALGDLGGGGYEPGYQRGA